MDRVLVVDDDPGSGALIKDILEESAAADFPGEIIELFGHPGPVKRHGARFRVTLATSGSDGIRVVREAALSGENITLAFVDIALGDMNGLDVGRQLRKIDKKIAVVYISGTDFTELFSGSGIEQPVSPEFYLQKPFASADIINSAISHCKEKDRETGKGMDKLSSLLNFKIY